MAARVSLDPGVSLTVLSRARTEADHHVDWGCGLTGETSRAYRDAIAPLAGRIRGMGSAAALAEAAELVAWIESRPAYRKLATAATRAGRRVLRDDVLFPHAIDPPRVLHARRGAAGVDVPVAARDWPFVVDAVASLARGAPPGGLRALARRSRAAADLLGAADEAGWLVESPPPIALPPGDGRVLFTGHNTAVVASETTRVLVDPWFRPRHPDDARYAPMQPADVGPVDAIAITHSHGDHFHAGSLLAFGRDVRIFVPAARESLLSSALAARLGRLGFRNVAALPWWRSARVGDVTIDALPFYGEQPTGGRPLYPRLRNDGNTYVVRTPSLSCAFLADSGRDAKGDMAEVAARYRKSGALVDVVFTGIRGFRTRPLFYVFTTVDGFFANVPLAEMTTPQQLMNDAPDALSTAERFGARFVVPYADGGAPWYWREGMGPRYPGYPGEAVEGAPAPSEEDPDADPYPERLAIEIAARGRGAKGPQALLLRPGDGFRLVGRRAEVSRAPGFAWPFDAPPPRAHRERKACSSRR